MNTAAQIVLLAAAGVFVTLRAGDGHAIGGQPLDAASSNDARGPAVCAAQATDPGNYLQTLTRLLVASEALELPGCDR